MINQVVVRLCPFLLHVLDSREPCWPILSVLRLCGGRRRRRIFVSWVCQRKTERDRGWERLAESVVTHENKCATLEEVKLSSRFTQFDSVYWDQDRDIFNVNHLLSAAIFNYALLIKNYKSPFSFKFAHFATLWEGRKGWKHALLSQKCRLIAWATCVHNEHCRTEEGDRGYQIRHLLPFRSFEV